MADRLTPRRRRLLIGALRVQIRDVVQAAASVELLTRRKWRVLPLRGIFAKRLQLVLESFSEDVNCELSVQV